MPHCGHNNTTNNNYNNSMSNFSTKTLKDELMMHPKNTPRLGKG